MHGKPDGSKARKESGLILKLSEPVMVLFQIGKKQPHKMSS